MDAITGLPILATAVTEYLCPGDRQPISQSLHLARLASGFVACLECPHREVFGSLPRTVQKQVTVWRPRSSLKIDIEEAIRGLYLNDLHRDRIREITLHLLTLVDRQRRQALSGDHRSQGPLQVVVGFDSRDSSADLAVGVVEALKRSAAEVIDVGQVTRPIFDYAVHHSSPHVGLFVTGGVHPPAWNGLDVVDGQGLPFLTHQSRDRLERMLDTPPSRIDREAGRYQPAQVVEEYQEHLAQLYYALRPLRIAVQCHEQIVNRVLKQVLASTPCDVRFVNYSVEIGADRQATTLTDYVCEQHLDFGFAVGIDGRVCQVIDETGTILQPEECARLICAPFAEQLNTEQLELLEKVIPQMSSELEIRALQVQSQLPVAVDAMGRCWFLNETPHCDAIQTLAKIVSVLSLSERPVSIYRTVQPSREVVFPNTFFDRFQKRPDQTSLKR